MYELYLVSVVVLIYIDIYDRLFGLCISSPVSFWSLPTVDYVDSFFLRVSTDSLGSFILGKISQIPEKGQRPKCVRTPPYNTI